MLIKNRFGRLVNVPEDQGRQMLLAGEGELVEGYSVPVAVVGIGKNCPYCLKDHEGKEECEKIAPLISIIIPSRWSEEIESLSSLEAQSYKKIEIIIEKDRFKRGANSMRNAGAKKAKGEYILFSDNDLQWDKDAIAILYKTLKENPKAGYAYGSYTIDGNVVGNKEFSSHDLWKWNYISTMSLIRREVWEKSGGFDVAIKRFQDWDLWLTLLGKGIEGVFCKSTLFTTKIREGITFGKDTPEAQEARKIILKKHSIKEGKLADIIIPHQNRHDLLKECLDRLSYDNYNINIIVGGTFSKNCNKGAKLAETEDLIFMNDDIEPEEAVMREMLESEEDIVGCAQVNPDQKRTLYGIAYAWKNGFIDENLSLSLEKSLIPTGFLFRIKRKVWEDLGGFDETFKNGGEDQELFLSALEKGYTIKIINTPTMHHHSQSRDRFKHTRDNRLELNKRWTPERVKKVIDKAKNENLVKTYK
jgi:GT2 family glycosyltransferase